MNRRFFTAIVFALVAIAVSAIAAKQPAQQPARSASGWQLPPDADTKKNPLPVDAKLIATVATGNDGPAAVKFGFSTRC